MLSRVRGKILLLTLISLTFTFIGKGLAQKSNPCQKARELVGMLQKNHFAPPTFDEALSNLIFEETFQLLDPESLFFTQESVESLSANRYNLEGELLSNKCDFFPQLLAVYKKSIATADSLVVVLSQSPLQLEENDTLVLFFQPGAEGYAKNTEALKKRWKQQLKYAVLQSLVADEKNTTKDINILKEEIPGALSFASGKARCNIQKILDFPGGLEKYVASKYLNAIAASYDPHSSYFSLADKQEFESYLSKDAYSFGMEVMEDQNGNIRLGHLVPGGPAWRSNKMHEGDLLLHAELSNKKKIDFNCLSAWEVEKHFISFSADPVAFTVRKDDGRVLTVKLLKEKLAVEENILKSFVLAGDKKIGYLSLPGFYTEWEEENPLGCANDVAKEILELKKEKIEGLILDLRFNGGGSVGEALNLAGIFIDHGPVGITSDRDGNHYLLKDINRGTVYDGPLLVLVNGQSASASEIIATALQDYNRALIVGSPTFGKASWQNILPLNSETTATNDFVKITTGKLYRLSGSTHQRQGVLPHIILPDILDHFPFRESSYPTALAQDKIQKKVYYTPLAPFQLQKMTQLSQARVSAHPEFQEIQKSSRELGGICKEGKIIKLDLTSFLEDFEKHKKNTSHDLQQPTMAFKVNAPFLSMELMQMDAHKKLINDELTERLLNDVYVEEAFYILTDFISLNQK